MNGLVGLFSLVLVLPLTTVTVSVAASEPASIRLLLSEVQPGSLSADQYCTLVFTDHRFHSEKASRDHGQDTDLKVYEGELSEAEWNALVGILDSKGFREQ